MRVRDQYGVDRAWVCRFRRLPSEVHDARAQHGIGEQADAGELEQHCGVADPGEPVRNASGGLTRRHARVRVLRPSL